MADILTITLPDGSQYNLRDSRIGDETLETSADTLSGAVNELCRSIENINMNFPLTETFTGSSQTNVNGNCQGIYIPLFSMVILSFNFVMSSGTAGTSTNLFRISSSYRPSATRYGSGYTKSSTTHGAARISVDSNGYVRQITMSASSGGFGIVAYVL